MCDACFSAVAKEGAIWPRGDGGVKGTRGFVLPLATMTLYRGDPIWWGRGVVDGLRRDSHVWPTHGTDWFGFTISRDSMQVIFI